MSSADKDSHLSADGHDADAQQDQFGELFGDRVEPLRGKGAAFVAKPSQLTPGVLARRQAAQLEMQGDGNFLDPDSIIEQVAALDPLAFSRPGVQHGVYKNLRMGKYEIQSRLDLHRHTVEQARTALWCFVDDCQQHAVRCALITHGKGEGRERPAILKSCVNHWLKTVRSGVGISYRAKAPWRFGSDLCADQKEQRSAPEYQRNTRAGSAQ